MLSVDVLNLIGLLVFSVDWGISKSAFIVVGEGFIGLVLVFMVVVRVVCIVGFELEAMFSEKLN